MLVLTRKVGEEIVIDGRITVVVNRIAGNRVAIGIEAPRDVHVVRGELERIQREFAGGDPEGDEPVPGDAISYVPADICRYPATGDFTPRQAR
jgi:carbon storage regulator